MTKFQSFFAHLAALLAPLLPFLLFLESAPGALGRYVTMGVSALIGVGLLHLPSPSAAKSVGNSAGYVRRSLLAVLCLAALFAAVACAALRSAEKSPVFVDAVSAVKKGDADAVKFCAGLPAFEKTGLVPAALAKDLDTACADLAVANASKVTVTVISPAGSGSASFGLAGAPAAQ